jgi:NAD(P)H-nitrite reductase large subunit
MSTDKDLIICRCEEVTLQDIKDAIKGGARTVAGIKRRTRAGMGLCQGKTCRRLLEKILAEELGLKAEDLPPTGFRPPVRPIPIAVIRSEEND